MIWLLRHGAAEEGSGDDAARELTEKGERQARHAGRALASLGVELDVCLASPKVRARERARLACKSLDIEPEMTPELAGGGFDAAALGAGRSEVLLVGHEPDLSTAIAELTGARVKMKKGGLAALDERTLHLVLRPSELAAIAGRG